jgi:hypothetical protein
LPWDIVRCGRDPRRRERTQGPESNQGVRASRP